MKHPTTSLLRVLAVCGGLSAVAPHASAKTATLSTQPVGIVTVTAPGGMERALSLPLEPSPEFVGKISQVGKRTIAWKGDGWKPRTAEAYRTRPFVVRMTDGRSRGVSYVIVAGNADALRLKTAEDITQRISRGDHFEILPADTLEGIFGTDGGGLKTGSDPALADNVRLLQDGAWRTYFHNGRHWCLRSDELQSSRNAVVIAPGQGFLVIRRAPDALSLQLTGDVPTVPYVKVPRGGGGALVGNPFPTACRLADLGLQKQLGLFSVEVQGADGWRRFVHRGGGWVSPGGRTSQLGPELASGSAVLVERTTGEAKP